MSDVQFINGLIIKPPVKKDGSPLPDFIKAKGSIKRSELIETLQGMEGEWVNFDVKESKAGNWYVAVDTWEPTKDQEYKEGMAQAKTEVVGTTLGRLREDMKPKEAQPFNDDDIPFSNYEYRTVV